MDGYALPLSMEGQQLCQRQPPLNESDGGGSPQDLTNVMTRSGGGNTDAAGYQNRLSGGGGINYSSVSPDINQILDQILNITDQSLDEAQVYM